MALPTSHGYGTGVPYKAAILTRETDLGHGEINCKSRLSPGATQNMVILWMSEEGITEQQIRGDFSGQKELGRALTQWLSLHSEVPKASLWHLQLKVSGSR